MNIKQSWQKYKTGILWMLGVLLILSAPVTHLIVFREYDWGGPADWANFSDYVGGLTTPLIAFVSVVLFYKSLKHQSEAVEKSEALLVQSKELHRSATEAQNEIHHNQLENQTALQRVNLVADAIQRELLNVDINLRKLHSEFLRFETSEQDAPASWYGAGQLFSVISEKKGEDYALMVAEDIMYSYKYLSRLIGEHIIATGEFFTYESLLDEIEKLFSEVYSNIRLNDSSGRYAISNSCAREMDICLGLRNSIVETDLDNYFKKARSFVQAQNNKPT